jgi:hypothetical protein
MLLRGLMGFPEAKTIATKRRKVKSDAADAHEGAKNDIDPSEAERLFTS